MGAGGGVTRPASPFVGSCPTYGGHFFWSTCISVSHLNPKTVAPRIARLVDPFHQGRYDAPKLDLSVGFSFGRTL